MKNDMIDRYIYAVTKHMNPKIREDVSKELYALVDDMLMERCGDMAPTEKDIRVVLTELGSPQELYAKYDEDSSQCLIGQPYYSAYKSVLRIVLTCMAVGLTIGSIVLQILEPQSWGVAIGDFLHRIWSGGFGVFAGLTILFAVFYRKGIKLDDGFNLDDLQPVPSKKQEITKLECIIGIVLNVLFAVVFLAVPEVLCAVFRDGGEVIPVFSTAALRSSWYMIVLSWACGIISETVKLMEGQYSRLVLVTTLIANAVSAVVSVVWLTCFDLINPQLVTELTALFGEEGHFIVKHSDKFQYFFMGFILIALAIDTVEVVVKTLKNKK